MSIYKSTLQELLRQTRSEHILILIQHIEDFNGIVFSIRTLEKWYNVFPIP